MRGPKGQWVVVDDPDVVDSGSGSLKIDLKADDGRRVEAIRLSSSTESNLHAFSRLLQEAANKGLERQRDAHHGTSGRGSFWKVKPAHDFFWDSWAARARCRALMASLDKRGPNGRKVVSPSGLKVAPPVDSCGIGIGGGEGVAKGCCSFPFPEIGRRSMSKNIKEVDILRKKG